MKIYPLKTGTIRCDQSVITAGRGCGRAIDVPATAWLIERSDGHILVDTGMCDTVRADREHYPGSKQDDGQGIVEILARRGLKPDDIDAVILTHLHWDHCSNLKFFSKSRVYVQIKEWLFANDPLPPYYNSYEAQAIGMTPPYNDIRPTLLDGDAGIVSGVNVITTPGHAPGHQSVVVDTGANRYVIAGDALMSYDNLEANPDRKVKFTMIGRYLDVTQAWASMERITKLDAQILPSHDFRVFEREVYL